MFFKKYNCGYVLYVVPFTAKLNLDDDMKLASDQKPLRHHLKLRFFANRINVSQI